MAIIKPFKAIRPSQSLVKKVASLPYDVMNSDEARAIVVGNPYSFLHVDKAEIDLDKSISVYDDVVYEKAKENLEKMINEKTLIQDNKDCLYIYKIIMNNRSQTGVVACTSVDEYIDGTIKKHELTREDKEIDRTKHVDICNANTGPIFLAYRENYVINEIINNYTEQNKPTYNFVSDDLVSHTVWIIEKEETITKLVNLFKDIPSLYIADGHHRNASAVKVALKRREEGYNGDEEFNFYLSVIFPDTQLMIMDYNRVVKDLNGLDLNEFLEVITDRFELERYMGIGAYKPNEMHTFGMYLNKQWYILKAKNKIISDDPINSLDVSILQNNLLDPILGIDDPRTDKRIDFVGGIRGIEELEKIVDSKEMKVAFSMYPTSMTQLFEVADSNKVMPPKSTWFEPKLRSGLFIHKLY